MFREDRQGFFTLLGKPYLGPFDMEGFGRPVVNPVVAFLMPESSADLPTDANLPGRFLISEGGHKGPAWFLGGCGIQPGAFPWNEIPFDARELFWRVYDLNGRDPTVDLGTEVFKVMRHLGYKEKQWPPRGMGVGGEKLATELRFSSSSSSSSSALAIVKKPGGSPNKSTAQIQPMQSKSTSVRTAQQVTTAQFPSTIANLTSNLSQTFPTQSTPAIVSSSQIPHSIQPLTISLSSTSLSISSGAQQDLLQGLPPVSLASSDFSASGASGVATATTSTLTTTAPTPIPLGGHCFSLYPRCRITLNTSVPKSTVGSLPFKS